MDNIVETYLHELNSGQVYLTEFELRSLFDGKLAEEKIKSLYDKVKKNLDSKKPIKSLKKMLNFIPSISNIDEVEKRFEKIFKDFSSNKKKASKVLKNSLPEETSDNLIEAAATMVVLKSSFRKDDEPDNFNTLLNKNLKAVVYKVNSFLDDIPSNPSGSIGFEIGEEKIEVPKTKDRSNLPDLILGFIIVALGVSLISGIVYGVVSIVTFIATSPGWLLFLKITSTAALFIAIVFGILLVIGWVLKTLDKAFDYNAR